MVAIDIPNIKDLFFPFKKRYFIFLNIKKLNQKNKYFSYLYTFFFDLIFEWDANLFKKSKSFLPFFPSELG